MHLSSMYRMAWFLENFVVTNSSPQTVMDVGSYNVNGTYRQLLTEFISAGRINYVGLDMEAGPNVDIAPKNPYLWIEIADNTFDVVISGQAFEHIEFPWLTIAEITRVVKPGGLVCLIAPAKWGWHRYPVDCWRFFSDGMVALARSAGLEVIHVSTNLAPHGAPKEWYGDHDNQDCMLIAGKPAVTTPLNIIAYTCVPADLEKLNSGFVPQEQQPYYGQL